jgi:hypothetical protein
MGMSFLADTSAEAEIEGRIKTLRSKAKHFDARAQESRDAMTAALEDAEQCRQIADGYDEILRSIGKKEPT